MTEHPLTTNALAHLAPIERDEAVAQARRTIEQTQGLVIVDEASQAQAMEALAILDRAEKAIATHGDPIKKLVWAAHKAVVARIDAILGPIADAKKALKAEAGRYGRALEAERLRVIEEERKAAAAVVASEGDSSMPDPDPELVAAPKVRVEGAGAAVQTRRTQVAEIDDPRALAAFWGATPTLPASLVTINSAMVLACLRNGVVLPGARLVTKETEAYVARR